MFNAIVAISIKTILVRISSVFSSVNPTLLRSVKIWKFLDSFKLLKSIRAYCFPRIFLYFLLLFHLSSLKIRIYTVVINAISWRTEIKGLTATNGAFTPKMVASPLYRVVQHFSNCLPSTIWKGEWKKNSFSRCITLNSHL